MTFLKIKFVFLKKVELFLLYNNKFFVSLIDKKIKNNFIKFHTEIILLYNNFKNIKNIFIKNFLILNKIICINCKKKIFIKKTFFIKKNFFLNKKKFFWVVSSDR
ncbi:hypothetical protein [Candidatus Carsonella ruddii]|uniref:hypothetical protein n=1 Tax=Carsonella ruddii TaxID=114186 RepID=UPI003D9A9BEC